MRRVYFLIAVFAIMALPFSVYAQGKQPSKTPTKTAAQQQQIENMVRDYLLKNPQTLFKAVRDYQRRQAQNLQAQQRVILAKISDDLKKNPNDPFVGNPQGDVTVVEFFDYRCPFCKKAFGDVQTLIKTDGNIRLVLKEFPILGPPSVVASNAAMAVWLHQKDKYPAFHAAMMKNRGELSQKKVFNYAKSTGVDVSALKKQMKDPMIARTLEATAKQAQLLKIDGTPAFIFGDDVQSGAIPLRLMKKLVANVRKVAATRKKP